MHACALSFLRSCEVVRMARCRAHRCRACRLTLHAGAAAAALALCALCVLAAGAAAGAAQGPAMAGNRVVQPGLNYVFSRYRLQGNLNLEDCSGICQVRIQVCSQPAWGGECPPCICCCAPCTTWQRRPGHQRRPGSLCQLPAGAEHSVQRPARPHPKP